MEKANRRNFYMHNSRSLFLPSNLSFIRTFALHDVVWS